MKLNFKKMVLDFFVELANIINHKNRWSEYYNIDTQQIDCFYHYGFTPVAVVKVYF